MSSGAQAWPRGATVPLTYSAPTVQVRFSDDGGWKGDIAEVLIFSNVLSSGDRASIYGYLSDRHGI